MNEERPLSEWLKPVRARLTLFGICRHVLYGLLIGSAAGVLVLACSRVWPMLHARAAAAALVSAGLIIGFIIGIVKRASLRDAAKIMDRSDTDDAIATALDGLAVHAGSEPAIVRLQRAEAVEAAKSYAASLRERLPWPAWRSWRGSVLGVGAAVLLAALLLVWPNPLDERAQAMAAAERQLEQLQREAAELAAQLEEAKLPEASERLIAEPLEELRSKLKAAGDDPQEALEELAEAMRELEKTADEAKAAADRLQAAAEAMSSEPALRQLGQALQDRSAAEVKKAMNELRSELQQLTPQQKEALAEALDKLGAELPEESRKLADAMKQAAEDVRGSGEGSNEEEALAALEETLTEELTQEQLEALARSMAQQLGQSGQSLAQQQAAQGGAVPSAWSGAASASGGGSSGSNGSGAGTAGQGSGSEGAQGTQGAQGGLGGQGGSEPQSGQGAGSGAGQGNSGAGSGAGAGAGSGGSGGPSGVGGLQGGNSVGGRNLITTPRSMAGSGNVQQDGGPSTGGQTQTTGDSSPMIDGTTRPYEEVYSEYATEARKSLSRSQLPQSMQDKVKQYFDQIQPNR